MPPRAWVQKSGPSSPHTTWAGTEPRLQHGETPWRELGTATVRVAEIAGSARWFSRGPQTASMTRSHIVGPGRGLWALDTEGNLHFCHHLTSVQERAIIDAPVRTPGEIEAAILRSPVPPGNDQSPASCMECPARRFCNGGCWAASLLVNGMATLPDHIECMLRVATVQTLGDALTAPSSPKRDCLAEPQDCVLGKCILHDCDSECKKCDDCERCYGTCVGKVDCDYSCQGCHPGD